MTILYYSILEKKRRKEKEKTQLVFKTNYSFLGLGSKFEWLEAKWWIDSRHNWPQASQERNTGAMHVSWSGNEVPSLKLT